MMSSFEYFVSEFGEPAEYDLETKAPSRFVNNTNTINTMECDKFKVVDVRSGVRKVYLFESRAHYEQQMQSVFHKDLEGYNVVCSKDKDNSFLKYERCDKTNGRKKRPTKRGQFEN